MLPTVSYMNSTSVNNMLARLREWAASRDRYEMFLIVTVNGVNIPLQPYQIDEQATDEDLLEMLIGRANTHSNTN